MTGTARLRTLTAVVALLASAAGVSVRAQSAPVATRAADALFADAGAKEVAVRKALAEPSSQPTMLKAVRTVVADYEQVVRQHPTSGFCDDALWRAATLAREAFDRFGESRERTAALRLFQLLTSEYPTSKFATQTPEPIAWLTAHPATRTSPVPAAATALPSSVPLTSTASAVRPLPAPSAATPTPAVASTSTAPITPLVNVKAIRRAVLKDVVRVVIELDAEIAFHDERLDNPNRVFIDLPSTRANAALIDQTLRFDADTDVVRQIRIGRHPNSVTRVVIEAAGVSSYSVYPLYSPYRLVIDCLREQPVASVAALASPPTAPVLPAPRPLPAAPVVRPAASPLRQQAIAPLTPVVALNLDLLVEPPPLAPRRIASLSPLPVTGGSARVNPTPAAPAAAVPALPVAAPKPAAAALTAPPARNLAGGLSLARQLGLGVSRIVIDPGHGGHDPGAKGGGINEAELVLDVALRLEKLLTKLPGVDVVLTRRENTFIPLPERTAIANREHADLFLSIHANASPVPAARGVETYFLNFASNQNAAAVAARENATSEQTMGALQDVVKAIALNSKRDESRDFATYVQRELLDSLRDANKTVKDLGVKQAPFVVLIGASMPSVLAEISFLTNPQEAKLLKGSSYRQKIAQALFEGVREYQNSLKRVPTVAQQQN